MIPDWMKVVDVGPCTCRAVSAGRKNFVKKSIDEVLTFFQDSLMSEAYAKRPGLLQSLDPRVKLVSILSLVVAISLTKDVRLLVAIYLLTLLFAVFSRIEPWFFIKRVWLFIPLFTGIIALPVIFNVFLPGDLLFTVLNTGSASLGPIVLPESIYITRQGVYTAAVFTIRVATSVSAVVLLYLTTKQDVLFKSFRSIGVPKIYVLTLDMCFRYIFLFMDVVRDLYTAKKSRSIKNLSMLEEQKWVGGRIGYTLIKTLDMSEKVHKAMMSRGFTGEVKIMHDFRMRPRDFCALATTVAFSIVLALIGQNILTI